MFMFYFYILGRFPSCHFTLLHRQLGTPTKQQFRRPCLVHQASGATGKPLCTNHTGTNPFRVNLLLYLCDVQSGNHESVYSLFDVHCRLIVWSINITNKWKCSYSFTKPKYLILSDPKSKTWTHSVYYHKERKLKLANVWYSCRICSSTN